MIALIVARSKNNVIGKNGKIPWQIEGEKKQFKELTTGNIVIMGRKSYEEIGFPLPNRKTIVVSKTKSFTGENLATAKSVKEALELAKGKFGLKTGGNIFFAGGYGIYKEALPLVEFMYITEVDITVSEGDTFFPEFNKDDFEMTLGEEGGSEIKFRRTFYKRRPSTF